MEYDKRLLDKTWRRNHVYKIKDKEQRLVQFRPNRAQEHFEANRTNRNIILKSRQLGFTTYEAIDCLDDVLFSKNMNVLMISYDKETALDVFKNKISLAWETFPDMLKELYRVDSERANQITYDFGDQTTSTIAVRSSGRSGTYNRLHITELGKMAKKYPLKAKELLEGTVPSVPLSGRVDIESTAEGESGSFYNMFWDAWNRGREPQMTEYKAHFYNWTWDDREISQIKVNVPTEDMEQGEKFKAYQEKYELTDQQITYYYVKWLSLERNWNALHQEYPTTPEEAFVGSGNKLFDQEILKKAQRRVRNGEDDGDWTWYEPYIEGQAYAAGVDVAEGVGQDSSTIVIVCFSGNTSRVVATYCSNKMPPDLLAYEVKRGCNRYGECMVAVERNNHGHTTIAILKGIYPNLYTEVREDMVADTVTEKLGWLTTAASKPKMMYELSDAINQDLIEIYSKQLIEELRTYDKEDIRVAKFNPEQSRHWDLLIALAIAWQMREFAFETGLEVQTHNNEVF